MSSLLLFTNNIQSYLSYIPFSYIPTSLISQLWRGTNFPILIPYKYTYPYSQSQFPNFIVIRPRLYPINYTRNHAISIYIYNLWQIPQNAIYIYNLWQLTPKRNLYI